MGTKKWSEIKTLSKATIAIVPRRVQSWTRKFAASVRLNCVPTRRLQNRNLV